MRALAVVLSLLLAAAAICQDETLVFTAVPPSPHRSMYVEGECLACHDTYARELDPHEFVVPISEMCLKESCHTAGKLGRSHPVGIDATKSPRVESVPDNIPLEDDLISCGSCHRPHGEWLSLVPCFPDQPPKGYLLQPINGEEQEIPYYKTYFLRVAGDPQEGFVALCTSCHPK